MNPAAVPTQAAWSRPRVVWPRWTDTVRVTAGDLQSPDVTCDLPLLKPPNQALQRTRQQRRAAEFGR